MPYMSLTLSVQKKLKDSGVRGAMKKPWLARIYRLNGRVIRPDKNHIRAKQALPPIYTKNPAQLQPARGHQLGLVERGIRDTLTVDNEVYE